MGFLVGEGRGLLEVFVALEGDGVAETGHVRVHEREQGHHRPVGLSGSLLLGARRPVCPLLAPRRPRLGAKVAAMSQGVHRFESGVALVSHTLQRPV